MEAPERAVTAAIDPKGVLVAMGFARAVRLVDVVTDAPRGSHLAVSETAWLLAFSPDGKALACLGRHGGLWLGTVGDSEEVAGSGWRRVGDAIKGMAEPHRWRWGARLLWSPAGDRVAVSHTKSGQISLWSTEGELVSAWQEAPLRADDGVAWSRDGSLLLYADGAVLRRRRSLDGARAPVDQVPRQLVSPDPFVSIAVHPTRDVVVTGHPDSKVRLWSAETGDVLTAADHSALTFSGTHLEVACLEWSPTGARLAASTRRTCYAFELDPDTLEAVWQSGFAGAHFGEAMPVVWSPDESHLWFSYSCGQGLRCGPPTAPSPEEEGLPIWVRGDFKSLPHAGVPSFAGGVGVLVDGGDVRLVGSDGQYLR